MKYLAVLFACLSLMGCGSTLLASTKNSAKEKYIYELLSKRGKLELFRYISDHRLKCVVPSLFSHSAYQRWNNQYRDENTRLSSDRIRKVITEFSEKAEALKNSHPKELNNLELISSPERLASLSLASEKCVERSMVFFNDMAGEYLAISEGKEFILHIFPLHAYIEAKSDLLEISYRIETLEYRTPYSNSVYTLDGYTEFMAYVYQFLKTSNRILARSSSMEKEQREKFINTSMSRLKKPRGKIGKDFEQFKALERAGNLNHDKKSDVSRSTRNFLQQERALNKSIDTFYPLIDEIGVKLAGTTFDTAEVSHLILHLDGLLMVHETKAEIIRLKTRKILADMITPLVIGTE